MGVSKRGKLIIGALVVLLSATALMSFKHRRCKQKNEVFRKQVETLKRDAYEQLRIGANRAVVAHFFTEHHIPLTVAYSQAAGSFQTTGCSPLGCGADSATIGVSVDLDQQGSVVGEPRVSGIYTDCL
jgi:hypothetical protein